MIRVSVGRVRSERVDELRAWFATLAGPRRAELLRTFEDEGVRHELVLLVHSDDGPLVIYLMEVEHPNKAMAVFENSTHPVDIQHRKVLEAAIAGGVEHEVLLDVTATPDQH